ncbi:hypothetical protein TNCV_4619111 [Trichonephila clavipes]|nr:hypothetical protein TNCV_4619111 [Trichonephila clavipes]
MAAEIVPIRLLDVRRRRSMIEPMSIMNFRVFGVRAVGQKTSKRSPYKALFESEPKIGFQSSHISKGLLEKLVTEEDLDLLPNQQDHDITSTPEYLPDTQLETANNSTSTPASTVKTSVVLLSSEWKAAVSDNKACCVVCGMEFTGAHSCDICKIQMHAICGNSVEEEG